MADKRIIELGTTGARPKRGAFMETDHATEGSQKLDLGFFDDHVNPRATQGALAFDGTTGSRVYATLTNQLVGSDSCAVVVKAGIPLAAPSNSRSIAALSSSNSATNVAETLTLDVLSSGALAVALYGPSGAHYRAHFYNNFIATYGGKVVVFAFVRDATAGTVTLYINGTAQTPSSSTTSGASAPAWTGTITNTYMVLGTLLSGYEYAGLRVFSVSLYNLALSQADVAEIQELGGGVPFRYQFGSQSNVIVAAQDRNFSSAGTGSWTVLFGTGTAVANAANALDITSASSGSGGVRMAGGSFLASPARTYRVRFTHTNISGTPVLWRFGPSGEPNETPTQFTPSGTPTAFDVVTTWRQMNAGSNLTFYAPGGNGSVLRVDDISVIGLGAVVHYDADLDGIGYQLHDQSTNKLDAVITPTGVSWTKPARRGYVRGTLTWSGTHEPKGLLDGQRCFPNEAVVEMITLKPTAGNAGSGMTIGATGNATRYTGGSYVTYTTAKKAIFGSALAGAPNPEGTTDNNNTMIFDPDTSNYTGSIQVEAGYRVTEGAP